MVSLGVSSLFTLLCISDVSAVKSGRKILDVHSLFLNDVVSFTKDCSVREFHLPDQSRQIVSNDAMSGQIRSKSHLDLPFSSSLDLYFVLNTSILFA